MIPVLQPPKRFPLQSPALLLGLALAIGAIFTPAKAAHADVPCPIAEPCIVDLFQTGNSIFLRWRSPSDYNFEFYKVRWMRDGIANAGTWEGRGDNFRLDNAASGVQYHLMVQGCFRNPYFSNTHSSTFPDRTNHTVNSPVPPFPYGGFSSLYICSDWTSGYVTTR